MCTDNQMTVLNQPWLGVLDNYCLRQLTFSVYSRKLTYSCLDTVRQAVFGTFISAWVNPSEGYTTTIVCKDHTFRAISTQKIKTIADLLNDSTHDNKMINNND